MIHPNECTSVASAAVDGPLVGLLTAEAAGSPARTTVNNNSTKKQGAGGTEIDVMGFKCAALSYSSFSVTGKSRVHAVRTCNTGRLPRIKLLDG